MEGRSTAFRGGRYLFGQLGRARPETRIRDTRPGISKSALYAADRGSTGRSCGCSALGREGGQRSADPVPASACGLAQTSPVCQGANQPRVCRSGSGTVRTMRVRCDRRIYHRSPCPPLRACFPCPSNSQLPGRAARRWSASPHTSKFAPCTKKTTLSVSCTGGNEPLSESSTSRPLHRRRIVHKTLQVARQVPANGESSGRIRGARTHTPSP